MCFWVLALTVVWIQNNSFRSKTLCSSPLLALLGISSIVHTACNIFETVQELHLVLKEEKSNWSGLYFKRVARTLIFRRVRYKWLELEALPRDGTAEKPELVSIFEKCRIPAGCRRACSPVGRQWRRTCLVRSSLQILGLFRRASSRSPSLSYNQSALPWAW